MLAILVHVPVAGFQSSAASTEPLSLLNPEPLVPPVASTVPSGKMVALTCRREYCIDPVFCHSGMGWLRSMISHVFVGGSAPPMTMYLPSPYCTALEYDRL